MDKPIETHWKLPWYKVTEETESVGNFPSPKIQFMEYHKNLQPPKSCLELMGVKSGRNSTLCNDTVFFSWSLLWQGDTFGNHVELNITGTKIHILSPLAEHSQYQHSSSRFREMASPCESSYPYGPQEFFYISFYREKTMKMIEKINCMWWGFSLLAPF